MLLSFKIVLNLIQIPSTYWNPRTNACTFTLSVTIGMRSSLVGSEIRMFLSVWELCLSSIFDCLSIILRDDEELRRDLCGRHDRRRAAAARALCTQALHVSLLHMHVGMKLTRVRLCVLLLLLLCAFVDRNCMAEKCGRSAVAARAAARSSTTPARSRCVFHLLDASLYVSCF